MKLGSAIAAMMCVMTGMGASAGTAPAARNSFLQHTETVKLISPTPGVITSRDGTCALKLAGFNNIANPGQPRLPLAVREVLVHPGIDWDTLRIDITPQVAETLAGHYRVEAAPPATRTVWDANGKPHDHLDWGPGKRIAAGRDRNVYETDAEFPGPVVVYDGTSQRRLLKAIRLRWTPVQYNPLRGTLRTTRAVDVRIRYAYRPVASEEMIDNATPVADFSPYINAENMASAYERPPMNEPRTSRTTYDLVVITTQHVALASAKLGDYIAHKTAQGFSVLVKTVDDIEAEYTQATRPDLFETTDERADRIKAFLKDKYLEYGIVYALLIGNPDPDDPLDGYDLVGDVPMKFCFPDLGINSFYAPTDSFYTDLTGQWDLDGDGLYGEWNGDHGAGGVDLAGCDVIVTRIPYYSANLAELDSILAKIIAYEDPYADQSWKTRCFMPNPIDWTDGCGREGNISPVWMAEWIKDEVLTPAGFGYYRIYEHNYDYPPHDVQPLPEQIPENLGYTCFTRYDDDHYFKAGLNTNSEDIDVYTITSMTDGDTSTAWTLADFIPGWYVQFKAVHNDDSNAAYVPYWITLHSDAATHFPARFRLEMAYSANFSDAITIVEETNAVAHAVPHEEYWALSYLAPMDISRVGGKRYIRLTLTGTEAQTVQINEFTGYTEEPLSIAPYVIPEWQNGYGVTYFNTHGWPQGACDVIMSSECWQLDNTRPSFVFSKACSTAAPEPADNLCAQLVLEGGIGSCGATRVSYGWGDQGYRMFMPKLIAENKPFGDVICETRTDMANAGWFGWAGMYSDAMRFNLYGDPTVRLIAPGVRGDMDCDGDVDFDDINPFVLALSGQAVYESEYPECQWLNADCDGDDDVDFDDINPFVGLLGG